MTGSDAHQRDLYRSGPWLLVHGAGIQSEATATSIAAQCAARDVECDWRTIDELSSNLDLAYYTALLVSLPDAPGVARLDETLRPFSELISCYRARRGHPLRDALIGHRRWHQVGAVHLIGYNVMIAAPQMRRARAWSCVTYRLEDAVPVDVFTVYESDFVWSDHGKIGLSLGDECLDETFDTQKEAEVRVGRWGISIGDAPLVLKKLDHCRKSYEDPRYPALYRPLPGIPKNRLDIILDGPDPDFTRPEHAKVWQENGARVWRGVEKELIGTLPGFHYPHIGRRGAVKALRELYIDLQVVTETWLTD